MRYPVDPEAVTPAPPFVPDSAAELARPVEVGPGRGAAFYLDGLEYARVRVVGGSGTPRFRRVFGGSRSSVQTGLRALVDAGAQKDADGSWRIMEPAGDGDVWCIDADAPTKIVVEHPRSLPARLAWEDAREAVLGSIATGSSVPRLPSDEGSAELEATLTAEAALGEALVRSGGPALAPAVRAWRTAAALRTLDAIRPFAWPYWSVDDVGEDIGVAAERILRVDGDVASSAVWRRVPGSPEPYAFEVEGPGILRVQVRSVLATGTLVAAAPTTARLFRDGVPTRALVFTGRPARVAAGDSEAFPVREVLTTRDGGWAGKINEIRVPLPSGKHTYTLSVDQPSLVRVARAQRKAYASEGLSGRASAEDWVGAARTALEGKTGGEADLLRALVADVVGEPPPVRPQGLSAELAPVAEYLLASYGVVDPRTRVGAWTAQLAGVSAPPWAWWLRVQMARLVPEGAGVRALFAGAADLPPAGLLPAAAERLGEPGLYQDRPDRALGALELAWRALPGDIGVRTTYLREFLDGSTWSRQSPVVIVNGDAVTPPPMTWLDTAAGTGGPVSRAARVFYRVPGGSSRTVTVDPSAADPKAPAIFSMFLRSPRDAGLLDLAVDDTMFRVLPLSDLERLDLAVGPGNHSVRLDTPAGTDAWVSGYPTEAQWRQTTDIATLRSYWPTAIQGNPLRFELPSPQVPVPIRLEVRVLDPVNHPAAVTGRLRTDTGADWPLTVVPGIADPTLLPIGGEAQISGTATVTVYPPVGTQQLWVDAPPDAGWVVSMSVRRDETTRAPTPWASQGAPDLDTVADLSRRIADRPTDGAALLRRADALAQLGDLDMARQDLRRLLRLGAASTTLVPDTAVDEVSERIDAAGNSGWLSPTLALERVTAPVALSPELVVAAEGAPPSWVLDLVRRIRSEPAERALAAVPGSDIAGVAWIRGRILRAAGREVEAAQELVRAWRSTGRWQYGLQASSWLVASEVGAGQLPTPGSGSLGYGLAAELRGTVEHPTVERLALLAGRRTRWDALRGADGSAGRARVTSSDALTPPLPQAEVREALTTPPWPRAESQFVTAKEPAAVSVSGIPGVTAAVWCQPLRVGREGVEAGCNAQLLVDGVSVARESVAPRGVAELSTPVLAPGRHDVELVLDDPSRTASLSVRFRQAGTAAGARALKALRDTAGFVATGKQPVSLAVAGPGTVFLEVRALGAGGPVDITATDGTTTLPARAVLLSGAVDRTVSVSGGPASNPGEAQAAYLVLPKAGTWRIAVTPRAGTALVRGAFRQETPAPTIERPGPMWRDIDPAAEPFDWPSVAPPVSAPLAGGGVPDWDVGTFSIEGGYGTHNVEDQATGDAATLNQTELGVAWRLQAIPRALWLHIEPTLRLAPETSDVVGAQADALARFIGPDLRLHLSGEAWSQDVGPRSAFGATFAARGYRPFRSVGGTYLIPSLEARARVLSLDTPPTGAVLDPDVWNAYAAAHPFTLSPEVMFWTMPFQDLVAYVSLGAVTNSDVVSLDQLQASLVGRAVVHPWRVPPIQFELKYRPSYRLASAYRSEAYVQHSLGASIGTNLRVGELAGLWLGVSNLAYLSAAYPAQSVVRLEARFDLHGGRALRDRLPVEQDFFDLLGSDRWGSLDEDGP